MGGNPYLQVALFVGGQVMQARAAKGARDVRIAQANVQKQQLEQQRIEIEEQAKQEELNLRLEEDENKSKIRAIWGASGSGGSFFGSRKALISHNEKMFDIEEGELLASKRNKLIENQYSIHGTALQKKAAREQYIGDIGRIAAETGSELISMGKPPEKEIDYGGGKTQSGGGRGTTGQAGQQASAGAPGTQSGKAVARKADTRR
jgi:hypothetical protein